MVGGQLRTEYFGMAANELFWSGSSWMQRDPGWTRLDCERLARIELEPVLSLGVEGPFFALSLHCRQLKVVCHMLRQVTRLGY